MRIVFVRHGHPDYRKDCLTEIGHLQAKAAAQRVRGEGIEKIYSSSHGRAVETANYIAEVLNLPVEKRDFIREIGWGSVDGEPLPYKGHPWTVADQMVARGEPVMNPDWATGEDYCRNQVVSHVQRIQNGLDEWLAELGFVREGDYYRVGEPKYETVAMVSHAGASGAALARMMNWPFPFVCAAIGPGYTAVTVIVLQGEKGSLIAPKIELMNDARHIADLEVQNVFGK